MDNEKTFEDVMSLTKREEELLDRLEERIPYIEKIFKTEDNYDLIMEDLIINSRFKALSILYPFHDYSIKELPLKYINWQYRCCIELFNLADKQGFSSYSENGLNWSRMTDGLSTQLIDELIPKAKVPKKVDDTDVGD